MLTLLCLAALHAPPSLDFHPLPGPQRFQLLILTGGELDVAIPAALGHALTARGWAARILKAKEAPKDWGHVLFATPAATQTEAGVAVVKAWRASGRKLAAIRSAGDGPVGPAGVEDVGGVYLAASTADLGRLAFALDAWAQDLLRQREAATGGDPP